MKHTSSRLTHRSDSSNGFALVLALLLMGFMVVGSLTLLLILQVEVRDAHSQKLKLQAQSNARLAMAQALGQIQEKLGPDTRVSANAALLREDIPHPYWLGVWNTRTGPEGVRSHVDHHDDPKYLVDIRKGAGGAYERPEPLSWLVSAPPESIADPNEPASPTGEWVTLLNTPRAETTVRAPRRTITGGGTYAWWVADQSQKALINQPFPDITAPDSPDADPESFHLIGASQANQLSGYTPHGGDAVEVAVGTEESKRSNLHTLESLRLWTPAASMSAETIREAFHDLTATSARLFTNTAEGGLKLDLTPFLEEGSQLASAAETNLGLDSITGETPILPGAHHQKTSPRFGALKGWWDLAFQLDSASGAAVAQASTAHPSLRASDPEFLPGLSRDLTAVDRPALQPVVVEMSLGTDFSPYPLAGGSGDGLRIHTYPRVILWNPFNVSLETERLLAMIPTQSKYQLSHRGVQVDYTFTKFPNMFGSGFQRYLGCTIPATTFEPGETKVFSPDPDASAGRKLHGKAAEWSTQNFDENVLTSARAPGVENFFLDMNVPQIEEETEDNRFERYGFGTDINHYYSLSGWEKNYVLYEAPGNGSITMSDLPGLKKVAFFRPQIRGDTSYQKWHSAGYNDDAFNNGTPFFREFNPAAPEMGGSLDNRRPPRNWRRGVRSVWYDESEESTIGYPAARHTTPLLASSNLRGGTHHHTDWLTVGRFTDTGWRDPHFRSHLYYRLAPDPDEYRNFFPPAPIARPSSGFPSTIAIYDVPRKANGIISIGQLQHAQLSYLSWHPSFILGTGWSTMNADLDATAIKSRIGGGGQPWQEAPNGVPSNASWDKLLQIGNGPDQHNNEVLIFDIAFEVNRAIWDRFMLSSIPYMGELAARLPAWAPGDRLPVGRYDFNNQSRLDQAEVAARLEEEAFLFHHAAEFLINRGGFNVNSTSVEAWKTTLRSLKGLSRPALSGGSSVGDHPFGRSLITGVPGDVNIGGSSSSGAWSGARSLNDAELAELAQQIVSQVRLRGPFLSLADFINRRLVDDPELAAMGTLDAAIANTSINGNLEEDDGDENNLSDDKTANTPFDGFDSLANRVPYKTVGLPGYFSQGDLLASLGPALSVRGDTFVIRAYGSAPDRSNADASVAEAWCEAVVQRVPAYVDPSDEAVIPPYLRNADGSLTVNPELSQTNRLFGRRFEVISFRWLDPHEI